MKHINLLLLTISVLLAQAMQAHQITVISSICGTPMVYQVDDGASVVLLATADAGSQFVRWSDGNTSNPRSVVATSDATYTAVFEAKGGGELPQQYTVTVYGGAPNPFVGTFDTGSSINIVAVPTAGYKFKRWAEDGNTTNPRTLSLTSDVTLHAEFEPFATTTALRTVAVQAEGCSNTIEGRYPQGTQLTLIAQPEASECDVFAHWEDASTLPMRVVTVIGDTTFVADFDKIHYTIRGQNTPSTGGSVQVVNP